MSELVRHIFHLEILPPPLWSELVELAHYLPDPPQIVLTFLGVDTMPVSPIGADHRCTRLIFQALCKG
ncbi:hypothetical protein ABAC460_09165 [Asticcacaulis sp. AC460]|nr:hypothetical protein ABAC460_09165 [Asticcacaulis sp. AC460]